MFFNMRLNKRYKRNIKLNIIFYVAASLLTMLCVMAFALLFTCGRGIIEYSENIRDKNLKLSEMSLQLDKLKEKFESNEKILQLTNKSLNEYTEKYTIERNKNRELENQLQLQRSNLEKLNEYIVEE